MIGRARVLLFCLVALLPVTTFARVLSYAPYSSRASTSSIHHREGRWFALAESVPGQFAQSEVVLYDSQGNEEPRVVLSAAGQTRQITFVAVYENRFPTFAPAPSIPSILIATVETNPPTLKPIYLLSIDGGNTFTRVTELDGAVSSSNFLEPDYGGPYSHGLTASVFVGDTFSFVFWTSKGIYAIDHAGKLKLLASSGYTLVGRDREGSRFLVRNSANDLFILDSDGGTAPLALGAPGTILNGWITPDGAAYVQVNASGLRYLYHFRGGSQERIAPTYENGNTAMLPFFAVPTNDYAGAWMIRRQTGKPTTLSRHTRATGLETMWSDVSGPEVEALHTANDANLLLIQVHRPRAQEERWFLDPALALWRVGQPAPRGYDELFLNEQWTKGFTHLRVDTMADGAPFIFDSGSPIVFNGCNICSPGPVGGGGGGGDVTQEWGVVRASLKQRLVLPGIARQQGAFNSYWLTDVVLHNPLDEPQRVDLRFAPLGGEVQTQVVHQKTLTLAAREIRVMKDVMKSVFELEQGGGVLYIDPATSVSATARTYTRAGNGSFGFGMQAIDFLNAASPRFPVTFAGAFPGNEYRTNMLLTDTSGRGSEARLRAHGLSGLIGADDIAFSAASNTVQQMNGIAGSLGLTATDAGGLTVQPTRGSVIATVVAMDNRTNDPTFFPPDLPAPVVRTIPVIGHLDGANNSKFRSDVYLLNPSTNPRTVTLEAKPWDSAVVKRLPFTLLPGEARVIRDALFTLFGWTGVARLRYSSNDGFTGTDGVRVTSRTYNIDENGGTYGSLVPPLNAFQSAGAGEKLEILGIVGGTEFRTNVGLVDLTPNANGQNAEARIHLVDQTGKEIDQFPVTFAAAGGMQINDIFNARGIAQPAAAMVYVEVIRGLIGAYATLTDNVTNDSTYLGASLSAQPN